MADSFPLPSFHFVVEWGGARIGFQEVSGLGMEVQVIEYREGVSPEYSPVKMPGQVKYNNITLKRGIVVGNNEFFEWWNTMKMNKIERRDITINLLNEEHEPTVVWRIKNAFPVKVLYGDLKAGASEVAIEILEIACEGITVQTV